MAAQRRFRRQAGRQRRLLLLVALGLLVVLPLSGWLVARSSLVELRTVTVEGTSRLSVAEVVAAADVARGQSLVGLDVDGIRARVEQLPPVAAATVDRDWPHGVAIEVTERTPAAVVPAADSAVLLDRSGVAFARADSPPHGLLPVRVSGAVEIAGAGAGNADARAAMRVLDALPAPLRAKVDAVEAPSPYNVRLQLAGDRTVVWGSAEDNATKASVLRALLRRPGRVYDVSAPGVASIR